MGKPRCLVHTDPAGNVFSYAEVNFSQFLEDGGDPAELFRFSSLPGGPPPPPLTFQEIPERPPWAADVADVRARGKWHAGRKKLVVKGGPEDT